MTATPPSDEPPRPDESGPAGPGPDEPRPAGPGPDEPGPAGAGAEVPDEAWLAAHAEPASVRRAPKLAAFVVAGALVGLVVGVVLALLADPSSGIGEDSGGGVLPMLGGRNGVRVVVGLAGAFVGGMLGAAAALAADRRSTPR